jgi:NAD(P)-dependent dehydrogenase (short-subunit alcohol dehydrogenase family)
MALADRVVAITGATGPLGRVATRRFGKSGACIGLIGRNQERLVEAATRARLAEGRWAAGVGELRTPDGVRSALERIERAFGRVDVLLHLVGGWAGGTPVVELDHDEVRSMLDQHLWTTLNMTQAVVPGMLERGWGRVVVVSSPFATEPAGRGASYALAKASEEVIVRSLAREVAGTGVTANVVVVRTIDMRHERETAPSPKNKSWTTPEEIADVLAFLSADEAGSINGARIPLFGRG